MDVEAFTLNTLFLLIGLLLGFATSPLVTPSRVVVAFALAGALAAGLIAYYIACHAVAPTSLMRRCAVPLVVVSFSAALTVIWWTASVTMRDHTPPVVYSLKALSTKDAVPLMKGAPLAANQTLYRFQLRNPNEADIVDVHVALDLPARVVAVPTIIDQAFADDVKVKPAFSVSAETSPEGTRQIPTFNNVVIIDTGRLRSGGSADIGVITTAAPPKQLLTATAPDGSIVLGVAPLFGRYGAVSVTRRHAHYGEAVTDRECFPIESPIAGKELIDMSKPLRQGSRSVFFFTTQEICSRGLKTLMAHFTASSISTRASHMLHQLRRTSSGASFC